MKINILGAGISGLTTAWKLSDKHNVEIFEKNPGVGGASYSFKHKDFILDLGPHKIYTQLPGINDDFKELAKEELMIIPKKNSLRLKGKFFDFPIRFTQLITGLNPFFGAKCGLSFGMGMLKKDKTKSYESYLKNSFGKTGYNLLFRDYAWKIWGDPKELSEELAKKRIPVSGFLDMVKGLLLGVKKEQSADEFYYPKYGIKKICDEIKKRVEKNKGKINTKSAIKSINISKNKVESITLGKRKIKTDYLISTIPITNLPKLIKPTPPKEVIEAAKKLKYRSLIILYLIVDKEKALNYNWIFFPEKDFIFNRVSEQKSFSKYTCPENKTAVMVEITCDFNDWRWKASDYDIFEMAIKDLEKAKILKRNEVIEYFTKKAKHVYPIYSKDYKENLNIILNYLDTIKNLETTGRQGLFNYNNMDHCIDMAKKTAEAINQNKSIEEWKELRRYFDSYKIVD